MAWCIWYLNGDTFTSDDGEPADAPGGDVLAIAQHRKPNEHAVTVAARSQETVQGYDWYIWNGMWYSVNLMGLVQYILEPGPKVIKCGRWAHPDVFAEVMKEASAWNG